jgi:hypothetical protein
MGAYTSAFTRAAAAAAITAGVAATPVSAAPGGIRSDNGVYRLMNGDAPFRQVAMEVVPDNGPGRATFIVGDDLELQASRENAGGPYVVGSKQGCNVSFNMRSENGQRVMDVVSENCNESINGTFARPQNPFKP